MQLTPAFTSSEAKSTAARLSVSSQPRVASIPSRASRDTTIDVPHLHRHSKCLANTTYQAGMARLSALCPVQVDQMQHRCARLLPAQSHLQRVIGIASLLGEIAHIEAHAAAFHQVYSRDHFHDAGTSTLLTKLAS